MNSSYHQLWQCRPGTHRVSKHPTGLHGLHGLPCGGKAEFHQRQALVLQNNPASLHGGPVPPQMLAAGVQTGM